MRRPTGFYKQTVICICLLACTRKTFRHFRTAFFVTFRGILILLMRSIPIRLFLDLCFLHALAITREQGRGLREAPVRLFLTTEGNPAIQGPGQSVLPG